MIPKEVSSEEREQEQQQCPLCGQTSFNGQPHKECMDYEQYMADNPKKDCEECNGTGQIVMWPCGVCGGTGKV